MALSPYPILVRGAPALTQAAAPVRWPDPSLAEELARLHLTLQAFRERQGFGRAMAAPQVGLMKRIIAMQLGATPFALINPVITWRSEALQTVWDDCLSVPDCIVRVERHQSISVRYEDELGRVRHWQLLPAEMAELIEHEIDHLDGVLMTERAVGDGAVQPAAARAALIDASRPSHRLSLANIARSATLIDPVFLNAPQYNCEPLSAALDCRLTIKLDFTNPIRSFKGRGASFLVHELRVRGDQRELVCASAGNWGQAMAYACRAIGRPITIFASEHANPMKLSRMRALGADVRIAGVDFDAAKDAAKACAETVGALMIEDGLAPEVSEGHGTLAMELLARGDAYDAVVIPLGNGALLNGIARWFKAASPATRVIGVCARGADAMEKSWRSGVLVETLSADSIADGIAVRAPIPEAVEDMRSIVDEVLLVDDANIVEAMRLAYRQAGILLEPAGAAGLAGIVAHRALFAGQHVATVLCGSNVTDQQIKDYFQ
jgi:peptide deformylase